MSVVEAVPATEERRVVARWSRLAAIGLLLVGLAPLIMLTAAMVTGMDVGEELGFFLGVAALALLASFLVSRFGTWAKVVGIVVALLGAMAMFWTAFGLSHPASVFDFLPGLMVIPGALLAISCCVAAIVAGKRGHLTAEATGGEAKGIRIALAVVGVAALVSGGMTFAGRSSVDADASTTVTAKNFEFAGSYRVEGGSQIVVSNEDAFFHTVTIDELGIDVALTPGRSVAVDVPDRPGTYVLYCKPHTGNPQDPGEDDMASKLIVT
jgi:plastocyanin